MPALLACAAEVGMKVERSVHVAWRVQGKCAKVTGIDTTGMSQAEVATALATQQA